MWLTPNPLFLDPVVRELFTIEECQRLVAIAEEADSWRPAGVFGEGGGVSIEPGVRSVHRTPIEGTEQDWPLNVLIDAVTEVNDQVHRYALEVIPGPDRPSILRYDAETADHYRTHADAGSGMPTRKLTFIVQLSEPSDYTGCDLVLTGNRTVGSRAQGALIVFPSYQYHRVTPVISGRRYAIVGWVHGPTFA